MNIIERAEEVSRTLVQFKKFQKASAELNALHERRGSLAIELLFDQLPDHERVNTITNARDKADKEADSLYTSLAYQLKESE